jgi:FkbM family methyltransferase
MTGKIIYRGARKIARKLGLGRARRLYHERYGWRATGALEGFRLFDPMLVEYSAGITEPEVTRTLTSVVQPGWTCVDVGAHKGYFTLLLAKLVGENGRVIAFEAHPDNAATSRRHAAVNGVEERVTVVNRAVSDGSEPEVTLYFGREGSSFEWNILGRDVLGRETEAVLRVPATTLDAHFAPGERIDFLKIDIEGAEAMALPGMNRILLESRPVLVVEFHNQAVWDARHALIPGPYTFYDISNGQVVAPGDGGFVHQALVVPAERAATTRLPWG